MKFACSHCNKNLLDIRAGARIILEAIVDLDVDYLDGEEDLMISVVGKGGDHYYVHHVICPFCGTSNSVPNDITYQVVI